MRRLRLAAKDRKDEEYGSEWTEIYDLTEIGFGGTKPQNISAVNMKNKGRAVLLSSVLPVITNRKIIMPKKDFFISTLRKNFFRQDFQYLHKLFVCERNNMLMRDKIERIIQRIIDEVLAEYIRFVRKRQVGLSRQFMMNCHMPKKYGWMICTKRKDYMKMSGFQKFQQHLVDGYRKVMKN